MRFICCTIWVLSGLLLAVSLDQRPDPPATIPHVSSVKALDQRALDAGVSKQPVDCDNSGGLSQWQVFSAVCALAASPLRPIDRIALTGHATDPSPPVA